MEEIKLQLEAVDPEKMDSEEEQQKFEKNVETISDQFNYGGLEENEKKQVDEFSKQIDIRNTAQIISYGSEAQEKSAEFSEKVLSKVNSSELGDVGETLTELVGKLNHKDENAGGLRGLFNKGRNTVENIRLKYSSAETSIEKVADILEGHQVTLMKDIDILDSLYEKNRVNFKELTMYIIAGNKAVEAAKNEKLVELQKKAQESGLQEDAQEVNDFNNAILRFEKRIHDLELTRMISIQMAPQIRMIQNNDTVMAEKIQSTLVNTIPLWKSQMLISLGLSHSQMAIDAENKVNEATNRMLKENAESLKQATVSTAEASERGIIDIETLSEVNNKLIETLDEVKRIQEEGKEKRAAAKVELSRIEKELHSRLLAVGK